MTGDWLSLDEGETITWSGGPRLTTILPAMVVGGAIAVLALLIAIRTDWTMLLVGALPVAVAVPVYSYLRVTNTEFIVTDHTVYEKTGVFGRRVTQASLSKVQNSSFRQGVFGSIFGYGTVRLEIAGGGDITFWRINEPETVRALVDWETVGEIPGNVKQWQAILSEVRRLRVAFETRDRSH